MLNQGHGPKTDFPWRWLLKDALSWLFMGPLPQILAGIKDTAPRRLAHTLYQRVVQAIQEGRLAHGLKLPSSRQLAGEIGISRNTVVNVYERLMTEGYVIPRQGLGFYVTHESPREGLKRANTAAIGDRHYTRHIASLWQGAEKEDLSKEGVVFDLFPGVPDTSHFPSAVWRRLCVRAARNHQLGEGAYADTQGREGLRTAIAHHLSLTRAVSCKAADIVVAGGTQQAIDLLCRFLVTPGKTKVAMEDPGYLFARRAFEMAGARIMPIPVDAEGLVVRDLPDDVDLIFVAPSHQFPLAYAMSPDRRRELIAFAADRGALILEDDYQAEFPLDGTPADALQTLDRHETVFYIGTFSKCMFPELRLGFIVPPRWAMATLLAAKQLSFHENPRLEQDALAAFISEGHLTRHIRKMRTVYADKRAAMEKALRTLCGPWIDVVNPHGATYITVRLRDDMNPMKVAATCRADGVRVLPLDPLYFGRPALNGFVIGLGRIPLDRIDQAIGRFAAGLAKREAADAPPAKRPHPVAQ